MPLTRVRPKDSSSSAMISVTRFSCLTISGTPAEVGHHRGDELLEETLLGAQLLAAEANGRGGGRGGARVATLGARRGAVGDGERQRADVVRDDAVRCAFSPPLSSAPRRPAYGGAPVIFWIWSKMGMKMSVS